MKWHRFIYGLLLSLGVFGCTKGGIQSNNSYSELRQFARVNCFYWYFKSQSYDVNDLRNISGGIVEKSAFPLEVFTEVSMLVREYNPQVEFKHATSPLLARCFYIDNDPEFLAKLEKL